MSMTLEKAIKLLKQYQGYDPMFPDGETLKHAFDLTDENVDTLLTALRPVSREQVERMFRGCEVCKGAKYVTGSVSAVAPYDDQHEIETDAEGDFDFCPNCGRPLTDEAVEMVMERMEALHDTEN